MLIDNLRGRSFAPHGACMWDQSNAPNARANRWGRARGDNVAPHGDTKMSDTKATVTVSKGRGDKALWSHEFPVSKPQTAEEWKAFWAARTKDPVNDVNALAYANYVVAFQAAQRGAKAIKEAKDADRAKLLEAAWNAPYVYHVREAGSGTAKPRKPVKVSAPKGAAAKDPAAWAKALADAGVVLE